MREGKELYLIFSNKTLEDTIAARPQSLEDLAHIKGWGLKKISSYGQEIVDLLTDQQTDGALHTLQLFETGGQEQVEALEGRQRVKQEDMVLSVSELIHSINHIISRLGMVRVQGEVSELRERGSAVYFTLKDVSGEEALVKCIAWKRKFDKDFSYLEEGMEIIASGVPEVYAKFGTFNLRVERVEPVGEGALQKAFEALKKKLEAKGYFREERKRPIPQYIRKIGIITSESGEAINDFRKNIGEYGFELCLYDVWVEGVYAEESIVKALNWMNKNRPYLDVIVLIRGGGGLENLKVFNSEAMADAIVTSRLPVLTGIGHERDETIAGYSSDKNLSTPTAVAAFIRTQHESLLARLESYADDMAYAVQYGQRNILAEVAKMANQLYNGLGRIFDGFRMLERKFSLQLHHYEASAREDRHRLERLCNKCLTLIEERFASAHKRIEVAAAALGSLDPEAILRRGYSIAYTEQGRVLKSAAEIKPGARIQVKLYQGRVDSRVEDVSM